jgi:hypothetical protein
MNLFYFIQRIPGIIEVPGASLHPSVPRRQALIRDAAAGRATSIETRAGLQGRFAQLNLG